LLAQQSLEKALKSVLCWHEKPVPFVYEIGVLVALASQVTTVPFGYELNELSEFATIRRYHEGIEEFSKEEIEIVLDRVWLALICRPS
jgi:HEPN domain-containing protein